VPASDHDQCGLLSRSLVHTLGGRPDHIVGISGPVDFLEEYSARKKVYYDFNLFLGMKRMPGRL
jgi:hypothetical protein